MRRAQIHWPLLDPAVSPAHESVREFAIYLRDALRLRRQLAPWLLAGELRPRQEARVRGEVEYALYRDPATNSRALVVLNSGSAEQEVVVESLGKGDGEAAIYRPSEEAGRTPLPASVAIPPGRFVVVVGSPYIPESTGSALTPGRSGMTAEHPAPGVGGPSTGS